LFNPGEPLLLTETVTRGAIAGSYLNRKGVDQEDKGGRHAGGRSECRKDTVMHRAIAKLPSCTFHNSCAKEGIIMNSQRPVVDDLLTSIALSRRTALLKMSTAGLAAALLVRGMGNAVAQDASPTPAYAAGVTAEILGRIEPPGAPGYTLQLVRVTFAPDAVVAAHRHSGGTVTTEVSGSHAFTVLEGNARLIRAGTGTPAAGSEAGEPMALGQEYTIAPGDVIIFDETVVHTAHNPNSEPAVLMEAQLRASDRPLTEFSPELATPVG
jgi:quercetin dioxygenase-like cupin family protein